MRNNNIWKLVEEKKAMYFSTSLLTITIVPEGKYAGVWTYNKRLKRQSYFLPNPADLCPPVAKGVRKKREVQLPLPMRIYNAVGIKNSAEFWKAHTGPYRKQLAWATTNFKQLKGEFGHLIWNWETERNHYLRNHYLVGRHIALSFCYRETVKRMKQKSFIPKMLWLGDDPLILEQLGVRKRQRFVTNVVKYGPKKALRMAFRNPNVTLINSMASTDRPVSIPLIIKDGKTIRFPDLIKKIKSPIKLGDIRAIHELLDEMELEEAARFVSKYGGDAVYKYVNYRWEVRRAHRMGICLDYPVTPQGKINVGLLIKWHDEVVTAINEVVERQKSIELKDVIENRREFWKNTSSRPEITPLITVADFKNEGDQMHHCVAGYAGERHDMFAHIKLNTEEQATLMFDPNTWEVIQLYSYQNGGVSDEMTQFVTNWLKKESK